MGERGLEREFARGGERGKKKNEAQREGRNMNIKY
jgi:hypothetical protein